ncbi:hypothetical protein EZS27_043345, partial [termite gut metagenome]
KTNHPNIRRIDVESAEEMYAAAIQEYPQTDIGILCAAVADFTLNIISDKKIKREGDAFTLQLKPKREVAKDIVDKLI